LERLFNTRIQKLILFVVNIFKNLDIGNLDIGFELKFGGIWKVSSGNTVSVFGAST